MAKKQDDLDLTEMDALEVPEMEDDGDHGTPPEGFEPDPNALTAEEAAAIIGADATMDTTAETVSIDPGTVQMTDEEVGDG